ncbi:major facilitator family transporter [Novosphingobium sp. Rr 2-17]|uniref:MFS transporter n=1 Tax=Novosphingobium sp. Rr 2-17 TaxID=555793 RepID=UPI000269A7AB|nr:MFS transporter [Novosphingobium sp. Rr 2-17]EIZ80645.1 major facilitator family transporter [Novosphingobium sp. Rr 2-17]
MDTGRQKNQRKFVTLGLVVASTTVGLMGTDLVLPAVPSLPEALGSHAGSAQLVLAAYVGGSCLGLILYGMLGDLAATTRLFVGSLLATALVSFACSRAPTIEALIALRIVQGIVSAGPAVFAPGIVKAMFTGSGVVRAMGALGSIEALAPALAPIVGAALVVLGGWQLSFELMAAMSLVIAALIWLLGGVPQLVGRAHGSFLALLRDPVFLRYALSQAAVLGGLLVFVFGMPTVIVRVFGGSLTQFVAMQLTGIAVFMVAANLAPRAVAQFGAEKVITLGTWLAAAGAAAQFVYALTDGTSMVAISVMMVPVNAGLGLRGPAGFFRAIVASRGDDARGSALVILGILGSVTLGTALVSPWIEYGSAPIAGAALAFHLVAVLSLAMLPKLECEEEADGLQGEGGRPGEGGLQGGGQAAALSPPSVS